MRGNRGVRRGRGRGRGRGGRGRGRGKKSAKPLESDEEDLPLQSGEDATEDNDENQQPINKSAEEWPEQQQLDMEADISLLEAPTFTTINRGPPEPMLRLNWDHRVNLMGDKVLNPMIHCCDQCNKPILIYGRMIPCKHVFCLNCAKQEEKICPRCNEKVHRVEQTGLGTVFMCVHGGTRYGNFGCRRTYLSQRDLQAHINHRHTVQSVDTTASQFPPLIKETVNTPSALGKLISAPTPNNHPPHHSVGHPLSIASSHSIQHPSTQQSRLKSDGRSDINHHRSRGGPSPPPPPPPPYAPMQHRPMMVAPGYAPAAPPQANMRTNLITVPIQDVEMPATSYHHYSQPPQYTHPPYAVAPPQQAPQYYPPVTFSSVQSPYVQGVAQVPQQVQQLPQNMSVRPPQYPDTQYRPPTTVVHSQQWQIPSSNPPPNFYR